MLILGQPDLFAWLSKVSIQPNKRTIIQAWLFPSFGWVHGEEKPSSNLKLRFDALETPPKPGETSEVPQRSVPTSLPFLFCGVGFPYCRKRVGTLILTSKTGGPSKKFGASANLKGATPKRNKTKWR